MNNIERAIDEIKRHRNSRLVEVISNDSCDMAISALQQLSEQSEQKEPLTIGDHIRKSNESLAEFMNCITTSCVYCECSECIMKMEKEGCNKSTMLRYLNQQYTEQ